LEKVKIAIIGGTGFETFSKAFKVIRVGTPYGLPPPLSLVKVNGKSVIFLPRHGLEHSVPPHKVNYRANIYALHEIGVERIIAVNAVGAINKEFAPADIIIPNDFIDFTKHRITTFYDEAPVTHIDFTEPYCPEIRKCLVNSANKIGLHLRDKAVLVCTEGPRFETPAEIEMFRRLGCDVVGMTGVPEAVLARELEICYATVCFVSNMAAGIQRKQLTTHEVHEVCKEILPKLEKLLTETIKILPNRTKGSCPCADALRKARFK